MSPTRPAALTVATLLREGSHRLTLAGIEGARAEARWLLARVLGTTDAALLAHDERPVSRTLAQRYRLLLERRAARQPFAYVVGERELYGRRFLVDERVLVPRPETETLIEEALRILAERLHANASEPARVIDVGTGSGAIACTLALEATDAWVIACDVSAGALDVAAENRSRHGLARRLPLVRGSLLDWARGPFDLIVANLPYLPSARIDTLMPEVADWEPRLALDGGPDGADLLRRLLADAPRVLRPGGTVLLELDPEQVAPLLALLPDARYRVLRDLAGLDRVLRVDLP